MSESDTIFLKHYLLVKVEDLAYAYSKPAGRGKIKVKAADFIVRETLSFEPQGEGTHAYLYIEKTNSNTEWLARQLARFAGIAIKDIGYAGLKDRNAVTSQWFSVKLEGIDEPDWDQLEIEGVRILQKTWHQKKLRRGAIKHNRFEITVRDIGDISLEQLNTAISRIQAYGVPNYFTQQRFGHDYNNLTHAAQWFAGTRKIKKRSEQSLMLSAARSMVFNQMLSQRIQQFGWNELINGEVMMLHGSHSIFPITDISDDIVQRFQQGDIHPTCPLWGKGKQAPAKQLLALEQQVAEQLAKWCQGLENRGLRQERRAARVFPENLKLSDVEQATGNDLKTITLSFALPSGSYATAVLRELLQY